MFAEDSVNNNRAANECNRGAKRGVSKGNEIKKKKRNDRRALVKFCLIALDSRSGKVAGTLTIRSLPAAFFHLRERPRSFARVRHFRFSSFD